MPRINELAGELDVKLPRTGIVVTIKKNPSYKDSKDIANVANLDKSEGEDGNFEMIKVLFVKWDLLDVGDTVAEFNLDNFKMLPMQDIAFLVKKAAETLNIGEEEEKKSITE